MANGNLEPIDFDLANKKLVAEGCGDLPVFHEQDAFISCWQLTDEHIQTLLDTKRIYLGVLATGHPPVWITVDYPAIQQEEWPEDLQTTEGEQNG